MATRTTRAGGRGWRIRVDRGGTFTDLIAIDPQGRLRTAKLLSSDPARYRDATVEGVRRLLGLSADESIPAERIEEIRIGTTVATNALLERRGAATLLVATQGLAEAVHLGRTHRPDLFALEIRRPAPLHRMAIEARERTDAAGETVVPLDPERLEADLRRARDEGIEAVAIVFAHAHLAPEHERRAAEIARRLGFREVVASHEVAPLVGFWSRGQTTVADACLSPVLADYVDELSDAFAGIPLSFMQSSGGRVAATGFRGRNAVLSGPAGGVVGAVETARAAGFARIIGFDMGGTSTDVSRFDGRFERTDTAEIAGVTLRVPMVRVHTVAAGGGSICRFDGERLRVGPRSAGADPGPVCYGRGGRLAVTDCNAVLGRLQPEFFPTIFGPDGNAPLDTRAARAALAEVAEAVARAHGDRPSVEELAEGFLDIAVEHMARAIKRITLEEGHDPRDYTLVAFGGAGGQHACRVADALEIENVFIHPLAGLLSAVGIGCAPMLRIAEESIERPLDAGIENHLAERVRTLAGRLEKALRDEARAIGEAVGDVETAVRVRLRLADSDTSLEFDWRPGTGAGALRRRFLDRHREVFGFADETAAVVLATLIVEAVLAGGTLDALALENEPDGAHRPLALLPVHAGGRWRRTPFYRRVDLTKGRPVEGPAVILDEGATTVVEPGWRAVRLPGGGLHLSRRPADRAPRTTAPAAVERVDAAMLERFHNFFMSIAEQMGAVLESTAASVNMKERLDFSCAVFDRDGALVANAPHMPVHLGSMGLTVKEAIARFAGRWRPGDAVVTNDPLAGGTHLPDVTVVMPVFLKDEAGRFEERPAWFVAARGHHADIGGIRPGSMPPDSVRLEEEGVVIAPRFLLRDGRFLEDEIRALLEDAPFPARNPARNVADLKAQLAACERGVAEMRRLARRYGRAMIDAYMRHIAENAARAVRRLIAGLKEGAWRYEMDCGAVIDVAIRLAEDRRSAIVDLTGCSDRHPGNFNAPRAVARAAVLYVFRTLVGEDIPLNDGCLEPIEIRLRPGSLLDPPAGAAVVAGNVETSQALTNALLLALGAQAASQGTMNNLSFGDARHQYYETICGGTGAGPGFDGADAVQSHMTNSRLTDVEILESRHPVRVAHFGVRRASGGAGRWRGGDGAIRELLFLQAMDAQILSGHRDTGPPGLAAGEPGRPGRNLVIGRDGRTRELAGAASVRMAAGDRLRIETPGGGGCGAPDGTAGDD